MTLPDPALDLIGFLRALGDEVCALRAGRDAERVGSTLAERALGYSQSYLSSSRYPWRVPEFGARGTMLPLSAWREWNESPDAARRARWDAMSLRERRELLGIERGEA